MAGILMSIEHGVEVGAEDVLRFITGTERKLSTVTPGALAGLAVILSKVAAVASDGGAVAAEPANIALDMATVADIKAVWPALKSFAEELGIKL